jgi:hypothetical protein
MLTTTAARATVMAGSKRTKRSAAAAIAASLLLLAGSPQLAAATRPSRTRVAPDGSPRPGGRPPQSFSWLRPAAAPAGWANATLGSGSATLFYPARWRPIAGDSGTVTASLRDRAGLYHGYLNVTPRQGRERLAGWAAFRTGRNREEGDTGVRELAAATGLGFRNAHGSCVIDDYLSGAASHPYRELACIVAGRRATSVFVGASLQHDWARIGPLLERAASYFIER